MRILGGIRDTYRKSEAAVVVQNLLELQKSEGRFSKDPASSATLLIDSVWKKYPHLFDGRFGQRPHKISLAACAFANAIDTLEIGNPDSICFSICLLNILGEVSAKGNLYPLNSLDAELINNSAEIFNQVSEELAASPLGKELDTISRLHDDGWRDWLAKYKAAASAHNSALKLDENGKSLIDFMDDEPARRAYRDGIDPEKLGKAFAEQFDIRKFDVK